MINIGYLISYLVQLVIIQFYFQRVLSDREDSCCVDYYNDGKSCKGIKKSGSHIYVKSLSNLIEQFVCICVDESLFYKFSDKFAISLNSAAHVTYYTYLQYFFLKKNRYQKTVLIQPREKLVELYANHMSYADWSFGGFKTI